MASITANTPTENKLFIENYNILQESKEDSEYTNLTHNYHTVDLVTGELSSVSRRELVTALNIDSIPNSECLAELETDSNIGTIRIVQF